MVRCSVSGGSLPEYQSDGRFRRGPARAARRGPRPEARDARAGANRRSRWRYHAGWKGRCGRGPGWRCSHGVTVLNSPGTVDSDYRGELKIILINLGESDFRVRNGDRIAQIVFSPVVRVTFLRQDEIASTTRGSGGFGSTGVVKTTAACLPPHLFPDGRVRHGAGRIAGGRISSIAGDGAQRAAARGEQGGLGYSPSLPRRKPGTGPPR